jgi:hypothetical protein
MKWPDIVYKYTGHLVYLGERSFSLAAKETGVSVGRGIVCNCCDAERNRFQAMIPLASRTIVTEFCGGCLHATNHSGPSNLSGGATISSVASVV